MKYITAFYLFTEILFFTNSSLVKISAGFNYNKYTPF